MSRSDCPKCWNTPCHCGEGWSVYRGWDDETIRKLQQFLTKTLLEREARRLAAGKN
jgi:ABC-type phosphate/phosphonate transport system substrate-binding protein